MYLPFKSYVLLKLFGKKIDKPFAYIYNFGWEGQGLAYMLYS